MKWNTSMEGNLKLVAIQLKTFHTTVVLACIVIPSFKKYCIKFSHKNSMKEKSMTSTKKDIKLVLHVVSVLIL